MRSPPDVGVVVVAAGSGERANARSESDSRRVPKQFRELAGVPVLLYALRPFLAHPEVREVVVALAADVLESPPEWLAALVAGGERLRLVRGGAERSDSVEGGVRALGGECEVVVVHDGARPFPDLGVIDAVIAVARQGQGAIAAVPVTDTLKQAGERSAEGTVRVGRTVPRDGLWRAQTPQAFPARLLRAALERARSAGRVGTDDAELVEEVGGLVALVPDVSSNLKITTADDFAVADAIARARR